MKSTGTTIKINALKKLNQSVIDRVEKDMEKIGGSIWKKNDHHRAYFPEWANDEVANKVYTRPYNSFIDLKTGDFVCEVSKPGWDKSKNNENDYWTAFKNILIGK